MRKELDELLCARYPSIFRDRHAEMSRTAMCWGFDCGDGWFDIINRLCTQIKRTGQDVRATQVKEKFGELRFYVYGGDEKILDLIDEATARSLCTCEACGKPGFLAHVNWWWSTLCPKCWDEKEDTLKVPRGTREVPEEE